MKKRLRLISTSPDSTEIICALGGIDDLVGISRHCDYPEGIQGEKPVISDFATADVDKIAELKPDVVFCSTYYQAAMVQQLVEQHIRVFVSQPRSLASVYDNVLLIAALMDRLEKGQMLVERMQTAMTPQPARGLKVFTEEWGDPIVSAAPWIQELVALAGGTPLFPELQAYTHTNERILTAPQVAREQPDVVLLPWCGCHGKVPVEKVTAREGWAELAAVQNNRVFPLEDSYFTRPGPRLIQGYHLLSQLFDSLD